MNKAVLVAAALVLAPLTSWGQAPGGKDREAPSMPKGGEVPSMQKGGAAPSEAPSMQRQGEASTMKGGEAAAPTGRADEPSQFTLKDRVAEAIETIETACADDIDEYCGDVTAGGGRVAMCMLAHEDRLSGQCSTALSRVAHNLRRNVDRVAEQCRNEIQTLCGQTGGVRQCLEQKSGSLSSPCQMIVAAVGERGRSALIGMAVYSSDNKNLGQIVNVARDPEGKIQSIQVDIGRLLGLGTKVVTITGDKLQQLPGVKVTLSDEQVRSLPEAKKQ